MVSDLGISTAVAKEHRDMMVRVSGGSFRYTEERDFDFDGYMRSLMKVPRLRDGLQPEAVNTFFSGYVSKKLGNRGFSMAKVRGIPKNKSLDKFRPIGDQSASPLSALHKCIGRFIDLCVFS